MKKFNILSKQEKGVLGKNMSFEVQEAFNLLRANLMLSFSDNNDCKIIGVTSALRGDGKSVSSINCAYTFALANKRVLLVECDLRLPTIYKKLNLTKYKGLSNYLTGQGSKKDIIKNVDIHKNFDIIMSGDIPPNPSELLGSKKMALLLDSVRSEYDIIILDMPPMNVVSDAIVLSGSVDGIVIVVRQNYTDCGELLKAVKQFEFAEVKVLGFILNDYLKKKGRYYKQHYKSYYRADGR